MPTLNVNLFGKFGVRYGDQELDGFTGRKVQELFAYLLLHRDHANPRDTLATILCETGNRDTAQSRKYLRRVLWQVQAALDSGGHAVNDCLVVDPEWIQLNSVPSLWLDVAVFEQALLLAQGT